MRFCWLCCLAEMFLLFISVKRKLLFQFNSLAITASLLLASRHYFPFSCFFIFFFFFFVVYLFSFVVYPATAGVLCLYVRFTLWQYWDGIQRHEMYVDVDSLSDRNADA